MGTMSSATIHQYKQPAKNRNLELTDNGDGSATVNGKTFDFRDELEDYLMSIERKDIPPKPGQ